MSEHSLLRRGRSLGLVFGLALVWGCAEETETQRMSNAANPCAVANPCAAMNPCAANPCAVAMNPCNPCAANPCARGQVSASQVTRPEGSEPYRAARAELVAAGEQLWKDTELSTNGLSCNSCHMNNQAFLATFTKPYPHSVAMAKAQANLDQVKVDEMVQLCMLVPMQSTPLPWDSKELASLAAYSTDVAQRGYVTAIVANPCMLKAAANPCNPCAANPCAGLNPCSANPCMSKMNPCNPCVGKNPCAR